MLKTFIYGNPKGFGIYDQVDESFRAYFRNFYDTFGKGRYLRTDRFPKGLTMYNYFRYGLHENASRGTNCVFGMSIALTDNHYYRDFIGLLKKFDSLFDEMLKDGVLFALENGIIRYKVLKFDDNSSYVENLKARISDFIENANVATYDDTFSPTNPDGGCATLSDKSDNDTILNSFKKYSKIALTTPAVKTEPKKAEQQPVVKQQVATQNVEQEEIQIVNQGISVESFEKFYDVLTPVINAGLENASQKLLQNINAVIGKETNAHIKEKYNVLKFKATQKLNAQKTTIPEKEQSESSVKKDDDEEEINDDIGNFAVPVIIIVLVVIMFLFIKDCGCSEDEPNESGEKRVEEVESDPDGQQFVNIVPDRDIINVIDDGNTDTEKESDGVAKAEKSEDDAVAVKEKVAVEKEPIDEDYIRREVLTKLEQGREDFVKTYFLSRKYENETLIKWQKIAAICDIINTSDTDSETKKAQIKACQDNRKISVDFIETELYNNETFKNAHNQADMTCIQEIIVFKNVK